MPLDNQLLKYLAANLCWQKGQILTIDRRDAVTADCTEEKKTIQYCGVTLKVWVLLWTLFFLIEHYICLEITFEFFFLQSYLSYPSSLFVV